MIVCLDALGTLLELRDPAARLVGELRARGVDLAEADAAAALRAEIAYYRAHHDIAVDAPMLALLRDRCTEVLRGALEDRGASAGALSHDELRDALLAALRFAAYPDVPDALRALRHAGHRLVVVSNWDVSLHDALRETGLAALVDGAISSAEAGAAKPDPRIFMRALELAAGGDGGGLRERDDGADSTLHAGAPRMGDHGRAMAPHAGDRGPAIALHAGDSLEFDVAGARAAGLRAVLVARAGRPPEVPAGVDVVSSLAELPALAT